MSSMLNADFVPGRQNGQEVDPEEYSQCLRWINEAKLPAAFKASGYDVINLSIFELQNRPPMVGEPFFRNGTDLLLSSTFYGRVLRKKIIDRRAARSWLHDPHYFALRFQDSTMRKLSELPTDKKRFVYAHFLTPHRPFYFDSSGRVMSKEDTYWASLGDEPVYYRASLRHAEKLIRRAVGEVMEKEAGRAVVMVIGDHGYRKTEYPGADPISFQGFAAVYFPDGDYSALLPGSTHVNTMRVAAGKALGIPFRRLPDSCVVLGRNSGRPNIKL